MFYPKMIHESETQNLFLFAAKQSFSEKYKELENKGWRFYVTVQTRGYCNSSTRVITIPLFAVKRSQEYLHYYLAHEMAHAFAGNEAKHGPNFMKQFKIVCDEDHWHFECGYKPRNALMAGIIPADF